MMILLVFHTRSHLMIEKDMRDYIETLAGHEVSPPVREAQLLRRVIKEEAMQTGPLLDAEAKDRFKSRLVQEGVLKKRDTGRVWFVPSLTGRVWFASALAAALLLLALNPSVLVQIWTGEGVSTEWKAKAMPLVIYTSTPTEQVQTFQEIYHKLSKLSPQHYEVGNTKVLEVPLPQPAPQEVVEVIHQYGLHLPPPQEHTGLLRPWIQQRLQAVGLVPRPEQLIQIQVTRPAGG
jgi:hypothetical protein